MRHLLISLLLSPLLSLTAQVFRRLGGVADEPELQGVIDCCFTGPEGLTVVDFKTDRLRPGEEPGHSERYRAQIEAYSAALSRITGVQVRRRVLWYFSTGTGVEI